MHYPRFEDSWTALDAVAVDMAWVRDILRMDDSLVVEDHRSILPVVVRDASVVGRHEDEEGDNVDRIHSAGEEVRKVVLLVVDSVLLARRMDIPHLDCCHRRSSGCCWSLNSCVALVSWEVPLALPRIP